ncbi:hypothetical protein NAV33_07260 [Pseudomonas stutzeri]|uniref:hypothetical protein n=1 Tax=Stutzerimonas stutzeri TaxID=316 RepID=UPI00210AFB91|nr:hypothetical protein [Stutzerimonas stutzeri]MCQ4311692.1 hypothetical protein [Stutzerimonas stutzeri]
MTVILALRKNDTRISAEAIQWWTNSPYSHCELVVDGLCYSSSVMDKGVRCKAIELDPEKWDLVPIPWADGQAIVEYFEATDHHLYGWPSLITSQLLNLNRPVNGAQFCSEWCAAALYLPSPASYSPASLHQMIVYLNAMRTLLVPAVA